MTRTAFRALIELPARAYQHHRRFWSHALLAAAWTGLYVLCSEAVYAYVEAGALPTEWQVLVAGLILIGGLWKPAVGYVAFVVAISYPLYLVSIYVMALALAVLILAAPVIAIRGAARHGTPTPGTLTLWGILSLAAWILYAPTLAPWSLTPLVPLLAGLLWGDVGGLLGGGLGALWLKVRAGMSGQSPDLWAVNDWSPSFAPLYDRYHGANSLQTVFRLVEPLWARGTTAEGTPGAAFLLLNVVQILAWAGAGYAVGALLDVMLMRRSGARGGEPGERGPYAGSAYGSSVYGGPVYGGRAYGAPVSFTWGEALLSALSLGPGMFLIWAGYVVVPAWLGLPGPHWLEPLWLPAQILRAGVIAWCVASFFRYLDRPLVPASWRARPLRSPRGAGNTRMGGEHSERRRWFARRAARAGRKAQPSANAPVGARGTGALQGRPGVGGQAVDERGRGEADAHTQVGAGGRTERGIASDIMIELD
jgi:hypothetical protein